MKTICLLLAAIIILIIGCAKLSDKPPVQTPPTDTTVTAPPKDTTTLPSKDTTTVTPPKDTASSPKDSVKPVVYFGSTFIWKESTGWADLKIGTGSQGAEYTTDITTDKILTAKIMAPHAIT